MSKKIYTLLCLVLWGIAVSAQNISVASFIRLDNDLTANTHGTMERDQNGEIAALIKIVTSEQGFTFDGGMVGITKAKQEVGEIWVYVPHGIKKITIKHQQLGVLRDYFFPVPIEKARTYEMVLTTGKVETVVTHSVSKQFVVFKVESADVVVELDDEVLSVDSEGIAQKLMPYGSYNYRVSRPNYHTEAGVLSVTPEGKVEKNITLRPNYGWIKISGTKACDGAYVYIDNERVGELPFASKEVKSGTHRVKIVKSMYKTYEQLVTISDNETTELAVELLSNFANVTLLADEGCEIWIDGQLQGKEQWSGPLQVGDYIVEVKKASYRSSSEIVRIGSREARTIQLKSPTPIYTSLEISSTPTRVSVYIDGVKVGTTPLFKNDVLVGTHRVEFRKEGYGTMEKTIDLQEGVENQLEVDLTSLQEINIVSIPSGANVSINGVYRGVTPFKTRLSYGKHVLRFTKNDYNSEDKVFNVDEKTTSITHTLTPIGRSVEITSNPSNASVKINGVYKGKTPLKMTLAKGSHLITISKGGYKEVSVYRAIPTSSDRDFNFKLDKLQYKLVSNDCYNDFSLYFDGYLGAALGNHRYSWDLGAGVGFYYNGANVEIFGGYPSLGIKAGWGFRWKNNHLITPQIGFHWGKYHKMTSNDYYHLEKNSYGSLILGCRLQYCLNHLFAIFVTPEYGISPGNGNANTFRVKTGLTFNLEL